MWVAVARLSGPAWLLLAAGLGCSGRQSSGEGAADATPGGQAGAATAGNSTATSNGGATPAQGGNAFAARGGLGGSTAGSASQGAAGAGGASGDGSALGGAGNPAGGGARANPSGGGGATGGAGGSTGTNCPWGDQAVHATEYGQATTLRMCLVSEEERKLRFQVATPATPAGGGYVVVSIRGVATSLYVNVEVSPVGGRVLSTLMSADRAGADFDTWFGAQPSANFFIDVSDEFSRPLQLAAFTASATFVPVPDAYETNNDTTQAKTLTPGTPLKAYAFDGYGRPTSSTSLDWYDWYQVSLKAGTPSITLEGAPSGVSLEVSLDDPTKALGYAASGVTDATGRVTIAPATPIAAGDYRIIVLPTDTFITPFGKGKQPPSYATQPYTLSVTE